MPADTRTGPTAAADPMGLPLISSTVIPVGKLLVGDWSYATVFVREGVSVRVSDSDQDDFVRNRTTLLGEARFGLAVFAPQAFPSGVVECPKPSIPRSRRGQKEPPRRKRHPASDALVGTGGFGR